jgi:hypothetical protein
MADNLTLILFLPLLGGLILSLLPGSKPLLIKFWANLVLGLSALWTISLLAELDPFDWSGVFSGGGRLFAAARGDEFWHWLSGLPGELEFD